MCRCATAGRTALDAAIPVPDWQTRHGGTGDDHAGAVTVAANGDLVMTGFFAGATSLGGPVLPSAGLNDAWIARYKPDGSYVWSMSLGGVGFDRGYSVAVDAEGDVYAVGGFSGPVNFGGGQRTDTLGAYLVKLDGATGAYMWDRTIGGSNIALATSVAIVDSNTVVIGGTFENTVDFGGGNVTATAPNGDGFLAAYNTATGAYAWARDLPCTTKSASAQAIASLGGDVVVVGAFSGTAMLGGTNLISAGASDLFLARYRGATGAHVWSVSHGGSDFDSALSVAMDTTHVFVGGEFAGTTNLGGEDVASAGFNDSFVAAYDSATGNYIWSQVFGSSQNDDVRSVAVSGDKLAVGLEFGAPITIGGQPYTNIGSTDVALVRLKPDTGDSIITTQFGSSSSDDMAIAFTPDDRLVGSGTFGGSVTLFGTELNSAGGLDIASFRADF